MKNAATTKPTFIYFALSAYGWGKSTTPEKAKQNCKDATPRGKRPEIKVYRCHPSTTLEANGMEWHWDNGANKPELITA